MKFSVLLLIPDYAADTFGQDVQLMHVDEDDVDDAIKGAQKMLRRDADDESINHEDFFPLLVLHGWHDSLI